MCEELQSNKKKTDKRIGTLARDLNRHFAEEGIQIVKTMERWFASLGMWRIKPQRDTCGNTPEGLELKRLTVPSVGKKEEEQL